MSEHPKKIRPEQAASPAERRRVGKVVHDDRGNASVEWRAAREDEERQVLEVLGEAGLSLKTDEVSYDPYARNRTSRTGAKGRTGATGPTGAPRRTDLRKLSEWIKQMRELEARKREDADPQEE
ncbi:MAG TPA: hypothetical protein VL220_11115 [Steroidobacteraceae bacterium]|nr:hypothetical protein [Steroidobacteraceae bacterium]